MRYTAPSPALRGLVLASSIFFVPPQAAELMHSAARPLQIATAALGCNLVPAPLAEKIWKKRPLERFYCAVAPEPLTFGLFTWLVSLPQPIETAKQKRAKPENLRMDSRQILFDFAYINI